MASQVSVRRRSCLLIHVAIWLSQLLLFFELFREVVVAADKLCQSTQPDNQVAAVTFEIEDKRFETLGGFGHWFHLLERLMPVIDYENSTWSLPMKTVDSKRRVGMLLLVFPRAKDVEQLGPFGRMVISATLLSNSISYSSIVFGSVAITGSSSYGESIRLSEFKPHFRVDRDQPSRDLFIRSSSATAPFMHDFLSTAATTTTSSGSSSSSTRTGIPESTDDKGSGASSCVKIIERIVLRPPPRKFEWFHEKLSAFLSFRHAVGSLCNITYDDDSDGLNDDKNNRNHRNIDGGGERRGVESIRSSMNNNNNFANSNNMASTALPLGPDDLIVEGHYLRKKLAKFSWEHKPQGQPVKAAKIAVRSASSSPVSSSASSLSSVLPTNSYSSSHKNKIVNGGNTKKWSLVIYQRDKSRKITNLDEVARLFNKYLLLTRTTGTGTLDTNFSSSDTTSGGILLSSSPSSSWWDVRVVHHSPHQPPCELIAMASKTTVFFTSHGFQSTLLLFQPLSSVLIEVHPAHYYRPEVYGFLQAGLRQNFDLARSYLAEESEPTTWFSEKVIQMLDAHGVNTHTCLHSPACRYYSRLQDVMVSPGFVKRAAEYLHRHFILSPAPEQLR